MMMVVLVQGWLSNLHHLCVDFDCAGGGSGEAGCVGVHHGSWTLPSLPLPTVVARQGGDVADLDSEGWLAPYVQAL